jgi:hypothetical protein
LREVRNAAKSPHHSSEVANLAERRVSEDAANHTDVSIAGDDASEEAPQKAPVWGPDTRALLEGWRFRVTRAQFGHQLAADKTRRWHFVLGVPIVILTTIVGTSAFAAIGDSPSTFWKILAGTVSLLAAVLASVQTFLGYGERSERHRIAATRYANTRRSIDLTLVNHQAASIPFIRGDGSYGRCIAAARPPDLGRCPPPGRGGDRVGNGSRSPRAKPPGEAVRPACQELSFTHLDLEFEERGRADRSEHRCLRLTASR